MAEGELNMRGLRPNILWICTDQLLTMDSRRIFCFDTRHVIPDRFFVGISPLTFHRFRCAIRLIAGRKLVVQKTDLVVADPKGGSGR